MITHVHLLRIKWFSIELNWIEWRHGFEGRGCEIFTGTNTPRVAGTLNISDQWMTLVNPHTAKGTSGACGTVMTTFLLKHGQFKMTCRKLSFYYFNWWLIFLSQFSTRTNLRITHQAYINFISQLQRHINKCKINGAWCNVLRHWVVWYSEDMPNRHINVKPSAVIHQSILQNQLLSSTLYEISHNATRCWNWHYVVLWG